MLPFIWMINWILSDVVILGLLGYWGLTGHLYVLLGILCAVTALGKSSGWTCYDLGS